MDDKTMAKNARSAAKGGRARAAAMSPEDRKESARIAALSRWGRIVPSLLPKETHSGEIRLSLDEEELLIPCSVLENRTRVISTRGLGRAMGSRKTGTDDTKTGAPQLPPFLAAQNLSPFVSDELRLRLNSPSIYRLKSNAVAYGYEAELLPAICKVIQDADRAGVLKSSQEYLVKRAGVMLFGFAKVGVIALVDEATGYQAERAKDELQKILQAYVVEEMRPWIAAFPTEFFRQIYRLYGWKFEQGNAKRPGCIGNFINNWIYRRLPTPVLPVLRRKNPAVDGRRKHKHHQFLTEETGIPHLDKQIASVTTLMRASNSKEMFNTLLVNAFPRQGEQLLIPVYGGEPEAGL